MTGIGGASLLIAAFIGYGQLRITNNQLHNQEAQAKKSQDLADQQALNVRYDHALDLFMDNRQVARLTGALQLSKLANESRGLRLRQEVETALTVFLRQPPVPAGDEIADRLLRAFVLKRLLLLHRSPILRSIPGPGSLALYDLRGVLLKGVNLDGFDLSQTDFGGADLSQASLRSCAMSRTRFAGATLDSTNFDQAVAFDFVDFSAAKGHKTQFRYILMNNVMFHDARLVDADFSGSTINGAIFVEAKLLRPVFRCTMENAVFSSAVIIKPSMGVGPFTKLTGYGVEVLSSDVSRLRALFSSNLLYYPVRDDGQWMKQFSF